MKTIKIDIPDDLRLGQAIIVALQKSGDLRQTGWDSLESSGIDYIVTGTDLFYMDDKELQAKLRKALNGRRD